MDVKKPPIREVEFPSGRRLTVVGRRNTGGVYVLRIRITEPTSVSFGRFKKGNAIHLPAGDYLYVGSARGIRGAVSLATRLLRHATRLPPSPPHAIREHLESEFRSRRLLTSQDAVTDDKKYKWHVDYLLDLHDADLVEVFAVRTDIDAEFPLAKMIATDPGVTVIERGLGASDHPGGTHLLRVHAGETWWRGLAARLQHLVLWETLRNIHSKLVANLTLDRLTADHLVKLCNMFPTRSREVLTNVTGGMSFPRAEKETAGTFDTHDWTEVLSRLQRGRGSVERAAAVLFKRKAAPTFTNDAMESARQLSVAAASLKKLVAKQEVIADDKGKKARRPGKRSTTPSMNVIGLLRACLSYVTKNLRQIPQFGNHHFDVPQLAVSQKAEILSELNRIVTAAEQIIERCRALARPTKC